jgi:hypothetical protein
LVRVYKLELSVVPKKFAAPALVLPPVDHPFEVELNVDQTGLVVVPVFTWNELIAVLKTIRPVAGNVIALICVVFILGRRKPLLVLLISSIALVSGRLPVVFIAMFCAKPAAEKNKIDKLSIEALIRKQFFGFIQNNNCPPRGSGSIVFIIK